MSEWTIYQDQRRCIGCKACEVHCKIHHDLKPGPRFGEIMTVGPEVVAGAPRMQFVFMPCFHCETAWCVSACPTGAMRRRTSDRIVWVDGDTCIGCTACMTACPWGIPQWDEELGRVVKCDHCRDRLDAGLEPACVTGCVTGSLRWVRKQDVAKLKRSATANQVSEPLR
jgi:Fe-S-cluster-containing dehydrogenase component